MKKSLITVLILAMFIVVYAYDSKAIINRLDADYRSLLNKGYELYDQGKVEEAIKYYLQYLEHKRDDQEALFETALAFGELNEPELAGRFILEAVRNGWNELELINKDTNFSKVKDSDDFKKYRVQIEDILKRQKRNRGDIAYIELPLKIRYRTVLPDNFNPKTAYTVLIMMHGFGGNLNDFNGYTTSLHESNIIYVTLQAPYPFENVIAPLSAFSWDIFDLNRPWAESMGHDFTILSNYILKLTDELKTKYKVNKVFLAGYSQGGRYAVSIGITNPNKFDGVICFGGGLQDTHSEDEVIAGKSLPVFFAYGLQDTTRLERFTKAIDKLKKAGYNLHLHTYEGGHWFPKDTFDKAISWLKGL